MEQQIQDLVASIRKEGIDSAKPAARETIEKRISLNSSRLLSDPNTFLMAISRFRCAFCP